MCTVSWILRPDGYDVFFNRDELRSRRPAEPPRTDERDGVRVLAPRDGDHGGTWLAVNAHGVTVGMVNGYPPDCPPAPQPGKRSRGLLLLDLATSATTAAVRARLAEISLADYAAFTLVAFGRGEPVIAALWDRVRLTWRPAPVTMPLCSSSHRTAEVEASRRAVFARCPPAAGSPETWLPAYHAGHVPERGAFSVCMHRDDAQTVSYSHVVVDAARATFAYQPGPPCEGRAPIVAELPLRMSRA